MIPYWYSKEEKDYFKQNMLSEDLLRGETPGLISDETIDEYMSIENLLHILFKKRGAHSSSLREEEP
jgi:hypothetical protein